MIKRKHAYGVVPLLAVALSFLFLVPSGASASSDGAEVAIENIGPVETVRGYLSGNPDNTYFPGDFFHVKVNIKSAGRRGVAVTDRWKRYDKKWRINYEKPWYDGIKTVDEKKRGQWYADEENAREQADRKERQSDVVDSGVEKNCTDWDYRAWWIYEGESDKNYSEWYEEATGAALKRDQIEAQDNVEEAGIDSGVDESSCMWRAWWTDRDWKVELLKLKPLARVYLYNASAGGTSVDLHPQRLELKEGKYVTKEVIATLKADTDPGRYEFEVEMTPPHRGHNNPYADVPPVSVTDNVNVVQYDPTIRHIPYPAYHWKSERTEWMIQKPNAVVTRYDGSKTEEGRLTLGRRVVVSGISVSGGITTPLRANDLYLGVDDNGVPKWSGQNGELHLSYRDNGLSLAQSTDGKYYTSGSIVSPVFDAENFTGSPGTAWEKWEVTKNTPGDTGIKVYIRAGNRMKGDGVGGDWVPLEDVEMDEVPPNRRYFQYWVVLYTGNEKKTPKVKNLSFSTTSPHEEWSISSWEDGRGERKPKAAPPHMNYFRSNRHTVVWREGEIMEKEGGVPETGALKVTSRGLDARWFPYTPIVLELKPQDLPERLQGKTDTLKRAPPTVRLILKDVTLFRTIEKDGKKVFIFAPGGTNVGGFGVAEETSFRYGAENRYKKWNIFFHTDWRGGSPYYPMFLEWFEDATVGLNVEFWFHQKISWDGFEGGTLKRAFKTKAEWKPIADHQPIQIAAWELKDWAEQEVPENPRVVLKDNAWKIDERVNFDYRFDSMESPENFLRSTQNIAKRLENRGDNLGLGRSLDLISTIGEVMENFGIEEPALKIARPDVGAFMEGLKSLAYMDNRMVQMILEDVEPEENGPQVFEGKGFLLDNVEYRIGGYFAVQENAWLSGDNVRSKSKVMQLLFDPDRTENFDINLTGEGLAAEVVDDGPNMATIRVYDPPRSGGIRHVAVYDNRGNLLMEENFHSVLSESLRLVGALEEEGWPDFGFPKTERTPTELVLEMTNEWGGTTTQTIYISPGETPGAFGFDMSWKWVVLGIFAVIVWVAAVRRWKEKKGGRKGGPVHPPW